VAAPGPVSASRLSQAAENVETVLRIASARGITQARIALRPQELGGVEIVLRATAGGLAAQVVADSPQAAEVLQQAGGDLRRALEAQGVNVLSLDISLAGDRGSLAGGSAGDERRGGQSGRGAGGSAEDDALSTASETTLTLPNGVLVDVLA
jgi:flagellar hook-length control protein FliK